MGLTTAVTTPSSRPKALVSSVPNVELQLAALLGAAPPLRPLPPSPPEPPPAPPAPPVPVAVVLVAVLVAVSEVEVEVEVEVVESPPQATSPVMATSAGTKRRSPGERLRILGRP